MMQLLESLGVLIMAALAAVATIFGPEFDLKVNKIFRRPGWIPSREGIAVVPAEPLILAYSGRHARTFPRLPVAGHAPWDTAGFPVSKDAA